MTPTSPRQVIIDPHLPAANRSHSITMSPNALSPSRAMGPHLLPHPHRNNNTGRSYRDEEGARERQMQQDIESAMSMCGSTSPIHPVTLLTYTSSSSKIRFCQPGNFTWHATFSDAFSIHLTYRRSHVPHVVRPRRSRDGSRAIKPVQIARR